jgi:peptide/nickel transport system substrate-binding protein
MPLGSLYAAVLFILLAACAPHGRAPDAPFTFTGLAGEPDTLNPLVSASDDLVNLSHLYMSLLVESDGSGHLIPEIAVRVPTVENGGISKDGRSVTYHLRHGVRWQDGAPLTARDVVFSYRAVMNPANNVLTRVGYTEIAAIDAPDPTTIVVRLRRPFSPVVAYFFGPQGYPALLPEHLLARYADLNRVAYNQLPLGAGPYRVVQWKRGDSITFAANPRYWRGMPHIARLIYRIVPDPNTRMQQLKTGETDAYFDVDPQLLPQVRSIPGVHVVMTPVNDLHILEFNAADPVMRDVRVRRAVALAIDRKKLIEAATHGAGLSIEGDQPQNGWAHDRALPRIPFDPQRASQILDTAGWRRTPGGIRSKNGRPLSLTLAIAPQGINGSALVATMVQQYLHDAGIAVTIKQFAPGLMWEPKPAGGILANGHFQIAYNAWWTLGPDPDDSWNFGCDQIPPGGENYYEWCDPRADSAMQDALRTVDTPRRRRDYAVVQRELVTQLPELTLWQVDMPNALRVGLEHFEPSPAGSAFWNAWRWSVVTRPHA